MTDARTDALVDLEREVGVLVRRIRRVIGERANLVHPDLQPAGYLILSWLSTEGPVRPSAIVGMFHTDKGAISRQLQHLVDLGLVDRTPDPDDGRALLVAASEDAVRRLEEVSVHRRQWLGAQLKDWSGEELAGFARQLERYNSALDA